ncbi:MAG: asparagine synthase (glutamine-hydrolyzing), partial [Rhodospirillales bacterium]|nr:asparagine synthase (glutamine-hydrolyzing) [Rhodospirillales bacterium]
GPEPFKTRSDCEPPLHIHALDGADFPVRLRGMYAIAIAEPGLGRLTLARDPFGIKPLYYTENDLGFAFASEPRALIEAGQVGRELDAVRRDELLQVQFTSGAQTIFSGIKRVLPGQTLIIEEGRLVSANQRPALPSGPPEERGDDEALALLDEVLEDSVRVHQRSDVGYGMFLSGGIDSSALLACMRDLNTHPVKSFTAGFTGTGVADERDLASQVAKAAGADFQPVEFDKDDFWDLLPEITACLDDPAADYATLPTYKLGRVAREQGFKVILSGEGGDELFAGYGRYRRMLRPRLLGGRPMRRDGILQGLGLLRQENRDWRAGLEAQAQTQALPGRSRLQIAQATDCADWLAHDLLLKLDRCLMAHGVEGRTPFLDPYVASLAMGLPDRLKIRGRMGKYLLRCWLEGKLPQANPFSRKRGFTVPVAHWMAGEAKRLAPLMAAQPAIREICDPDAVRALFANLSPDGGRSSKQGQAAWVLLFYALWHRCHISGLAADGDVFHCLDETGARALSD